MRLIAQLLHGGECGLALLLGLGILEARLDLLESLNQLGVLALNIVTPHGGVGDLMRWGLGSMIPLRHGE